MKKKHILLLLPLLIIIFLTYKQLQNPSSIVAPIKLTNSSEYNPNNTDNTPEDAGAFQIPQSKIIPGGTHAFQTFNNCGPASLSMALSLYGINVSQTELGNDLRPYQNKKGDNDDKSVTLEEIAEKSKEFGFIPYHRPNGNMRIIKAFIANDVPVITRTWLNTTDDIGHFRVIKGYDSSTNELIQDDSYEGKNLRFTYDNFNALWKDFNFEYLVLIPNDKITLVEQILNDEIDPQVAWENAVKRLNAQLENSPNDTYARFNLAIALYEIGEYEASIQEFEKIETKLSSRTLWYQIEPILAYYETGNYDRVFEITENILKSGNRAFSELYYIRGQIYLHKNQTDLAKAEFEKAIVYNKNYIPAQEALKELL